MLALFDRLTGNDMLVNKKIVILSAIVAVAIATGLYGTTQVNAADDSPLATLVEKIATKFNVNQADVQAVFDEHRKEVEQQHQARAEDRLNSLVADGTLTEAQKKLILEKQKEMQTQKSQNWEAWRSLSESERRGKMQEKRDALKTWATENGIDLQYLMGVFGRGGHRGCSGDGEGMGKGRWSEAR